MTNNIFNKSILTLKASFQNSVNKINKNDNEVDWNKEEVIIQRLQHKLGKSREDVTKMVSKNLLDLLAMVPFSVENETK